MSPATQYAFTVGSVRFIAVNAFDIPDPRSFAILPEQLRWIERELDNATHAGQIRTILMHCYPSDLKVGRGELTALIRKFGVRLIDMGHTHYNEISNDGRTIYTATRSTGQIEEGPVGFSVTNIDNGVVSWRFLELGKLPAVVITSPGDERLSTESDPAADLRVRAKVWGRTEISRVYARYEDHTVDLRQVAGSKVWEAAIPSLKHEGIHTLLVTAEDLNGETASDSIRVVVGDRPLSSRQRFERDQDNTLPAWPEHGLLGTQLGPNKNGKKW